MQRNKFLEQLGLKKQEYGTNFCTKKDKRYKKWKKQQKKYGFDSRECWNLNNTFVEWLYSRLCMYKKEASKIIDLTYHTFEWNNETITLLQAIDLILEVCKEHLTTEFLDKDYTKIQEIMPLWGMILPYMWW